MLQQEKERLIVYGKKMAAAGLTTGSGGNISVRTEDGLVVITPSGVAYDEMTPEDLVVLDAAGAVIWGSRKPSSEAGFHLSLYRKREDIRAVVHTHSPDATTMACLGWEIPAVHYLVGYAGEKVPLAPYATFGSEELAEYVAEGIGDGHAVLLANHGLVATGEDLRAAYETAEEVEFVAGIYLKAKSVGEPVILGKKEMDTVLAKFKDYRRRGRT